MLTIILAAAAATTGSADLATPGALAGARIEFATDWGSGACLGEVGLIYTTDYYASGRYTDEVSPGTMADEGTYEYQQLSPTVGRITYHVLQAGTWKGGDYSETLHYTSATGGTYEGEGAITDCKYGGPFVVKPDRVE